MTRRRGATVVPGVLSAPIIVRVAVFEHARPGRTPLVSAYTRDYNPAWEGYCEHNVVVVRRSDAKPLALADHKAHCPRRT